MSPLDLPDDEKAALIELLRETIDRDRFPLSPRFDNAALLRWFDE
jgi:hypothetical protein